MVLSRDLILIPLPLAILSVAFFVGGVPEGGVLMALFTIGALWFIRPRRKSAPEPEGLPGEIHEQPTGAPPGGPV